MLAKLALPRRQRRGDRRGRAGDPRHRRRRDDPDGRPRDETRPDLLAARAGGGITAYVLLTLSVLAGLVLKSRPFARLRPADGHRVHRRSRSPRSGRSRCTAIALVLDTTVKVSLAALVVPGPRHLPAGGSRGGVVAGWLFVLITASFWVRQRIGGRMWRRLHWLTYAIFGLATVHGLAAGTDSTQPWARDLYLGALGSVVAATAWRALVPPAAAVNPERSNIMSKYRIIDRPALQRVRLLRRPCPGLFRRGRRRRGRESWRDGRPRGTRRRRRVPDGRDRRHRGGGGMTGTRADRRCGPQRLALRRDAARARLAGTCRCSSARSGTHPTSDPRSRRSCSRASSTTWRCAPAFWEEHGIELVLGRRSRTSTRAGATATRRRRARSPGTRSCSQPVSRLAGSRDRRASTICGRSTTRERCRRSFRRARDVVVVGAGFVGGEVASTLSGMVGVSDRRRTRRDPARAGARSRGGIVARSALPRLTASSCGSASASKASRAATE